jgi:hypothetical protein
MKADKRNRRKTLFVSLLLGIAVYLGSAPALAAPFHDRVVAFVDNEAITESEFEDQYRKTVQITSDVTPEDVVNTMINRLLLLKEAKKYRIEAASEEEVIREFIDLKVRAFIVVSEAQSEEFYRKNIKQFGGKGYEESRDEIEQYLIEKEVNERLKDLLTDLRKKAYVKVQLKSD